MKRLPPSILSAIFVLAVLTVPAIADEAVPATVDPILVAENAEASAELEAEPSFDIVSSPIPVLEDIVVAAGWLCIEPSPCQSHSDCGITREGFPGVCLPNFDYPEVPSPKVCLCP